MLCCSRVHRGHGTRRGYGGHVARTSRFKSKINTPGLSVDLFEGEVLAMRCGNGLKKRRGSLEAERLRPNSGGLVGLVQNRLQALPRTFPHVQRTGKQVRLAQRWTHRGIHQYSVCTSTEHRPSGLQGGGGEGGRVLAAFKDADRQLDWQVQVRVQVHMVGRPSLPCAIRAPCS